MLIRQAKLRGRDGLWDIKVEKGRFAAVGKDFSREGYREEDIFEAEGQLLLPPFVEPHIHLDSALTAGEPRWNISGTLFEGIECWAERKSMLTMEDVKRRAHTSLRWQSANGIQFVRSHVDVTDPSLMALKALLEVKAEVADWMELQLVAFPQEGIPSFPRGLELMEEALKMGADVVGAIPHFEFTREYGVESVKAAFRLADQYDRMLDVHCDEIDDEQSRFLEVVATQAYEYGIGHRVTASHTTAMHSYNNAYAYKLFRLLKMAGINFVANPLVNTHLQGRFDTYPKRRGVTRVKELLAAGLNVSFGHDDILDPWYPLGTGNMLQVLSMGLHVCQIMGYEEIVNSIDIISANGARTLQIGERYGIEEGKPANFIVLAAEGEYDAIRRQVPVVCSVRNGKVIVRTRPAEVMWQGEGKPEKITYCR